ncbi:MAG TPA: SRPBCC family protein [Solirubrobacterales bacterium]|nr:SRPBCC family protein [Solirubrobacterales bacterium]
MYEAAETATIGADPEAVWELWGDLDRWPEWNQGIERASADGELAPGATIKVKLRRGGTVSHQVTALEPGRLLVTEARFPGGRQGHEHRVERRRNGAEVTHRIYVRGLLWPLLAFMLSRRKMERSVAGFAERERELLGG